MAAIRCHYEVLAVERDVDDDTLKKAYRKLALKWHPDKNQGQIELATEQFKLIHNAYAVLSDPHERAWYDAHRDAILRGKSGVRGDGDDDDDDPVANLWSFFSTNAYSGFGDDARGFFSVYDKVFMDLDDEERRFAEKPSERRAPRFNDSNAGWREVKAFYDYWEAFSTQRSCAGADKYDTRAAANRQVRRAMEKENNKSRLEARRKVNECVRALVAYVKKRDKRVIAHQLAQEEEKRAKEAKLRTERAARQAEADEARRLQTAQLEANRDSAAEEEEQRRLDALLNEYEEEGGSGPRKKKGKGKKGGGGKNACVAEDEAANVGECTEPMGVADGGSDAMFCEACNKRFTNFGQWKNHEKSKKHHDMMRLLSERLAAEDEEFAAELAEAEAQAAKEAAHEQEQSSSDGEDSVEADLDGTAGREKAEAGLSDASASSEVVDDDDDLLLRLAGSRLHHSSSHAAHTGREASRDGAVAQSASVVDGADETVRLGDAHEVGGECKGGGPSLRGEAVSSEGEEDTAPSSTSESAPQSLSKKKARELKKAARAALKSDGPSSSDKYVKSQRGELVCSTCGYRAPSRNQLFNHLKALGHAAFKG